jgi:hypothetical protein
MPYRLVYFDRRPFNGGVRQSTGGAAGSAPALRPRASGSWMSRGGCTLRGCELALSWRLGNWYGQFRNLRMARSMMLLAVIVLHLAVRHVGHGGEVRFVA